MRILPFFLVLLCFFSIEAFAQCNGISNNACTTAAPTVLNNSISCTPPANQGGRRNFNVTNMIAGYTYRISNCGSGHDTQMTIRNASGTAVAFNDDDGPACPGTAASIDFTPTATGNYRIHLNRYNCSTTNALNGDIVVTLIAIPVTTPANDDCANATSLTVNTSPTCTTSTSGTTVGATQTIGAISCNGFSGSADDDVWYSFVATAIDHDITVTPGTINDIVVDLRSGSCNGTSIDCADATTNSSEVINATGLTIGNTYYVRVYSYDVAGNEGTFDICVTTPTLVNCMPTTESPSGRYIDTVSFLGTLQDVTNAGTGFSTGYQDFTGLSTLSRQVQGEGVNVYVGANLRGRIKAWVDWNKDDIFDFTTEEVYDTQGAATTTTTFGFVIPIGTAVGDYKIRIRIYNTTSDSYNYDFTPCEDFVNGSTSNQIGEAEDYLFTVEPYCDAIITSVTDGETCGVGTVDLSVTSNVSGFKRYRWYDAETGGTMLAETNVESWTTPSISTTTTYYVTVYNGTCESWEREPIVAHFNPVPTLTVTPDVSDRVICGENDMLEISATGDVDDVYLIDEDFESGTLGVFSNITISDNGSSINSRTIWQNQTSTFVPSELIWFPAISSGFGSDQFVISNSDVGPYTINNALQTTTSYDTTNYVNLTLSLDCYYSHYLQDGSGGTDDYLAIEASTDGTNWTAITPNIIADVGIGTKFETLSYDLSTYINEPTLSVRVRFYAVFSDGVAVDNIKLFGDKDITSVDWTTTPAGIVDLFIDTTGNGIGDTPYTTGSYETVYAMPTLPQLNRPSYSFSVNANLANGCGAVSYDFNIQNKTRVFNSAALDAWGNASNWAQNLVPTSDDCVVIMDTGMPIDARASANGVAKNITIKNGGHLEIDPGWSVTVTDWIHIESGATLHVGDGANLIQVTDVGSNNNTGEIVMDRGATGVGAYDYIYWSSPVEGFNVTDVSPGTNPGLIFQWNPTVSGNGAGNYGQWESASGTMGVGNGYIIRGISGTTLASTVEFQGRPNNGIITTGVTRGTYTGADYLGAGGTNATAEDDNWNLIGNPYPSAISADAFIAENASTISGTVYLWRHLSTPSNAFGNPFYSNYAYNYNEDDYVQYNSTGSNPIGFNGNIAAGQAFFVYLEDTAPASSTVQFNNTMRGVGYTNDQFYRSNNDSTGQFENEAENTNTNEKHRIWLDIIAPNNKAASTLIGYITGATDNRDALYDGINLSNAPTHIYSLIGDEKVVIQGKSLPFQDTDIVPLGVKIGQSGNYTIAINAVDGLFETTNQAIYIEDLYTNTEHDLRLMPYSFYSENGIFEDRFVLKYAESSNGTLDIDEFNENTGVVITTNSNQIKVHSYNSQIDEIVIYNMLGKRLIDRKNISQNIFDITNLRQTNSALIIKVMLENGKQKIQKVIY